MAFTRKSKRIARKSKKAKKTKARIPTLNSARHVATVKCVREIALQLTNSAPGLDTYGFFHVDDWLDRYGFLGSSMARIYDQYRYKGYKVYAALSGVNCDVSTQAAVDDALHTDVVSALDKDSNVAPSDYDAFLMKDGVNSHSLTKSWKLIRSTSPTVGRVGSTEATYEGLFKKAWLNTYWDGSTSTTNPRLIPHYGIQLMARNRGGGHSHTQLAPQQILFRIVAEIDFRGFKVPITQASLPAP